MTGEELTALVAAGVTGRWVWRAYFHPFAKCRRCKGTGRNHGSTRRQWGACRHCDGSGRRQVIGSRAIHKVVRGFRVSWRERKEK